MVRIGICGKQGTGKNLTGRCIERLLDPSGLWNTTTIAFADPIKQMACLMFPWAERTGWYGASRFREEPITPIIVKDNVPLTYRQVLKDIGGQGRAYDPDHWVKVFGATIRNLPHRFRASNSLTNELIITTDVRYRNEYDYLRKEQFFIIKLLRNTDNTSNHPTETAQDEIQPNEFDAVIDNNGTIEQLKLQLEQIKSQMLAKSQ